MDHEPNLTSLSQNNDDAVSNIHVKFGETYYSEEVLPQEFTWYSSDGTVRRYVKDFLIYNHKGERLLRFECDLRSMGLNGISNDFSYLENSILFAKAYNVELVHTHEELLHANHPCLSRGQRSKGESSRSSIPKHHRYCSVRAIIDEWFLDYSQKSDGKGTVWLISKNDVYYRLDVPSGRYTSSFSTFSVKADIIKEITFKYFTTKGDSLIRIAEKYLNYSDGELLCSDYSNVDLLNQILIFLLSELSYLQLIPRYKDRLMPDLNTIVNFVKGSDIIHKYQSRFGVVEEVVVPELPPEEPILPPPPVVKSPKLPKKKIKINTDLYVEVKREKYFPPEYQEEHMLLPPEFDFDGYSTHSEYEFSRRYMPQLPLVDELTLNVTNRIYYWKDLPLRTLVFYPFTEILEIWHFIKCFEGFLNIDVPSLPSLEVTLGTLHRPDDDHANSLLNDALDQCIEVSEYVSNKLGIKEMDPVMKSLDLYSVPHPILPYLAGKIVNLTLLYSNTDFEYKEPILSKQDIEMCEEILSNPDWNEKKWVRRFRKVVRMLDPELDLTIDESENPFLLFTDTPLVINFPFSNVKIKMDVLYPDLQVLYPVLELIDNELIAIYQKLINTENSNQENKTPGVFCAKYPKCACCRLSEPIFECVWPLLLRRHLFLISHNYRKLFNFYEEEEELMSRCNDEWVYNGSGGGESFVLEPLLPHVPRFLELVNQIGYSPQAQTFVNDVLASIRTDAQPIDLPKHAVADVPFKPTIIGEDRYLNKYIYFGPNAGCNRIFVQYSTYDHKFDNEEHETKKEKPAAEPVKKEEPEPEEVKHEEPSLNEESEDLILKNPRIRRKVIRIDPGMEGSSKKPKLDVTRLIEELDTYTPRPHKKPRLIDASKFFFRHPTYYPSMEAYKDFVEKAKTHVQLGFIDGVAHARKFISRMCSRTAREKTLASRIDKIISNYDKNPPVPNYIWSNPANAHIWALVAYLLNFEKDVLVKISRCESCRNDAAEILWNLLRSKPVIDKLWYILSKLYDSLYTMHIQYKGLAIFDDKWRSDLWLADIQKLMDFTVANEITDVQSLVGLVGVAALMWHKCEKNFAHISWVRLSSTITNHYNERIDDSTVLYPGTNVFIFTKGINTQSEMSKYSTKLSSNVIEYGNVIKSWKLKTESIDPSKPQDEKVPKFHYMLLIRICKFEYRDFIASLLPQEAHTSALEDETPLAVFNKVGQYITRDDKTTPVNPSQLQDTQTTSPNPQNVTPSPAPSNQPTKNTETSLQTYSEGPGAPPAQEGGGNLGSHREVLLALPADSPQYIISQKRVQESLSLFWKKHMRFKYVGADAATQKFTGYITSIDYEEYPWLNVHVEWDRSSEDYPVTTNNKVNIWQLSSYRG